MRKALYILLPLLVALILRLYLTLLTDLPFSIDSWKVIKNTELHRTIDNGEFSLLIGLIEGLKNKSSNVPLQVFILCDYDQIAKRRISKTIFPLKTIRIIPIGISPPKTLSFMLPIVRLALYIPLILKSKIVIHLGADGFSDEAVGGCLSTFYHDLQILIARFLKKASTGTFGQHWSIQKYFYKDICQIYP